jgi:anaerobic ribonucleoside-triphosphate reductase
MIQHTKHDAPKLEDHERQPCEVWTRVMGYYRPVSQFNHGKKSEHAERRSFKEPTSGSARG